MEIIIAKVLEIMSYTIINSNYYWGTGIIACFFLLALFLLIVSRKKSEMDKFILIYICIIITLYFFPITAGIIMDCIGVSVYWRMHWLIPMPIIVAYVIVKQMDRANSKKAKIVIAISSGIMLAIGGNYLYSTEVFDYKGNIYGVPQSTIDACDVIMRDARKQGISEYYIAASEEFSPWVRQYAPTIKMLYGRNGENGIGKKNENAYEIYYMLSVDGTLEWDRLIMDIKKEKCNYLISTPNRISKQEAEEHGFRVVGQRNNYIVLTLD